MASSLFRTAACPPACLTLPSCHLPSQASVAVARAVVSRARLPERRGGRGRAERRGGRSLVTASLSTPRGFGRSPNHGRAPAGKSRGDVGYSGAGGFDPADVAAGDRLAGLDAEEMRQQEMEIRQLSGELTAMMAWMDRNAGAMRGDEREEFVAMKRSMDTAMSKMEELTSAATISMTEIEQFLKTYGGDGMDAEALLQQLMSADRSAASAGDRSAAALRVEGPGAGTVGDFSEGEQALNHLAAEDGSSTSGSSVTSGGGGGGSGGGGGGNTSIESFDELAAFLDQSLAAMSRGADLAEKQMEVEAALEAARKLAGDLGARMEESGRDLFLSSMVGANPSTDRDSSQERGSRRQFRDGSSESTAGAVGAAAAAAGAASSSFSSSSSSPSAFDFSEPSDLAAAEAAAAEKAAAEASAAAYDEGVKREMEVFQLLSTAEQQQRVGLLADEMADVMQRLKETADAMLREGQMPLALHMGAIELLRDSRQLVESSCDEALLTLAEVKDLEFSFAPRDADRDDDRIEESYETEEAEEAAKRRREKGQRRVAEKKSTVAEEVAKILVLKSRLIEMTKQAESEFKGEVGGGGGGEQAEGAEGESGSEEGLQEIPKIDPSRADWLLLDSERTSLKSDLEQMFHAILGMKRGGDEGGAAELAEANAAAARLQIEEGEGGVEQAAMLNVLSQAWFAMGEGERGEALLRECTALLAGLPTEPLLEDVLENTADLLFATNRIQDSLPFYRDSIRVQRELAGGYRLQQLATMESLIGALERLEETKEAVELVEEKVRLVGEVAGQGSQLWGAALLHQAQVLATAGRRQEAKEKAEEALSAVSQVSGASSRDAALVKSSLADMTDSPDESLLLMEESVRILKSRPDLDVLEPGTERAFQSLADKYEELERYHEGLPLREEILQAKEFTAGPYSPSLIQNLIDTGDTNAFLERFETAEKLYRRALSIARASFPAGAPQLVIPLDRLAGIVHRRDRHDEAETLLREELAIIEGMGQENEILQVEGIKNLASVLYVQERYAEVEQLLKRGLLLIDRYFGPRDMDAMEPFLRMLVSVLQLQEKYEEAARVRQRLRQAQAAWN